LNASIGIERKTMVSRERADPVRRLRALAWLLDESIPLPGGYRIGLDPLIGLVPGFGDAITAILAAAIVDQARRSGAPASVLLRMIGNLLADAAVGSVPILGDLFDAAFKANIRNLALLERHRADPVRTRRASRLVIVGVTALLVVAVLLMIALPIFIVVGLAKLF
jgi:hypothetical protein